MHRRTLLGGGAALLLGGGTVGAALGVGPFDSDDGTGPDYLGSTVVYEREDLLLSARPDPVELGDDVTFEMEHTGDSGTVSLGCNVTWALQADESGEWTHVTWTGGRYYDLCATQLRPGETATETVSLSVTALEANPDVSEVAVEDFSPGTYRFVLVDGRGSPYLAVNFRVRSSE